MSLSTFWRQWFAHKGSRIAGPHQVRGRFGKGNVTIWRMNGLEWLEDRQMLSAAPVIIDNIDPGFSLTGDWAPGGGPGIGRNNNVYVAFGESFLPTDTAAWTFDQSGPGRYRVSATWFTNTGFPHLFTDSARFELFDTAAGMVRGTALINQKVFPDDFTDAGSDWEDLGVFDITGSSLIVRLTSTSDNATYVVADAIRIERIGDLPAGPEVQVLEAGFDIAVETGQVSFGAVDWNRAATKTFTVANTGMQDLTIGAFAALPSGYTLTSPPALNTLAPGQSTTFAIRLDALLPGTYAGPFSFTTNDPDEDPFNFNVTGTVSTTQILDDGDPGFQVHQSGLWGSSANGVGRDGDFRYAIAETAFAGSNAFFGANWTFTVTPGAYRVAATWAANPTYGASNSPFIVFNNGMTSGRATLDQRQAPNDFDDAGSAWEDFGGVYYISGTTLKVRLPRAGDGYVIADGIRIERVGDLPLGPEIEVSWGTLPIANNAYVPFGYSIEMNDEITGLAGYGVVNVGQQTLTLGPITVPAGFVLYLSQPPPTELAPGQSGAIYVRRLAALPGTATGPVSFDTNDPDESPFSFTISSEVLPTRIRQESQASQTGVWAEGIGAGSGGRFRITLDPAAVATIGFGITPGRFRVSATWPENSAHWATNATYTVTENGIPRGTATLNQRLTPNDVFDRGVAWEDVGVFNIASSSIGVRLSAVGADGYVVSDAIRIERVGDISAEADIQVTDGSKDVPKDTGTVSIGTTELFQPMTRTITIVNQGSQPLVLTGPIAVPTGYTLVTPPGTSPIAPGGWRTFTARLDAQLPGTHSGLISIFSNDSDDSPFNFNITGTVLPTRILDNGQSGYSQTGDFQSASQSDARDGDISYVFFQAAPSEAFWTFSVTPGQYRIAGTWFDAAGNASFSSNSPFTILDGGVSVETALLDQRFGPNDFVDAGSSWEIIGEAVNIFSTTLTVRLTNVGANGYVLADAIRIERLGAPGFNAERGVGDAGVESSSLLIAPLLGSTLRPEESDALDQALLGTTYWDDELEDVATALAAAQTREESYDDVASGRIDQLSEDELELALSDWL